MNRYVLTALTVLFLVMGVSAQIVPGQLKAGDPGTELVPDPLTGVMKIARKKILEDTLSQYFLNEIVAHNGRLYRATKDTTAFVQGVTAWVVDGDDDSDPLNELDNETARVSDYAALGTFSGPEETAIVTDEITGGVFIKDATATTVDGGVVPVSGWRRQFDGPIQGRWFGTVGDGTTDNTAAIASALSYIDGQGGGHLVFESGVYATDSIDASGIDHLRFEGTAIEETVFVTRKAVDKFFAINRGQGASGDDSDETMFANFRISIQHPVNYGLYENYNRRSDFSNIRILSSNDGVVNLGTAWYSSYNWLNTYNNISILHDSIGWHVGDFGPINGTTAKNISVVSTEDGVDSRNLYLDTGINTMSIEGGSLEVSDDNGTATHIVLNRNGVISISNMDVERGHRLIENEVVATYHNLKMTNNYIHNVDNYFGSNKIDYVEFTNTFFQNDVATGENLVINAESGIIDGITVQVAQTLDILPGASFKGIINTTALHTVYKSSKIEGSLTVEQGSLPVLDIRETSGSDGAMIRLESNTPFQQWRVNSDYQGVYGTGSLVVRDQTDGSVAMEIEKSDGEVHINRTLEMEAHQIKDVADGTLDDDVATFGQLEDVRGSLYVLASGQSNMDGNALGGNTTTNDKVFVWDQNTSQFKVATIGEEPFETVNGYNNLAFHFCKKQQEETGKKVYLVFSAQGSQSIDEWVPETGAQWSTLISRANASGVSKFDYFLWHQGEQDNGITNAAYEEKYDSLKAQLRRQIWFPETTPIIIGELLTGANDAQNGFITTVNGDDDPWDSYADVTGLTSSDGVHFDGPSLVTLGRDRYWQASQLLPLISGGSTDNIATNDLIVTDERDLDLNGNDLYMTGLGRFILGYDIGNSISSYKALIKANSSQGGLYAEANTSSVGNYIYQRGTGIGLQVFSSSSGLPLNIIGAGSSGSTSSGRIMKMTRQASVSNDVNVMAEWSTSTSTAQVGFGSYTNLLLENASGTASNAARWGVRWEDPTLATLRSAIFFNTRGVTNEEGSQLELYGDFGDGEERAVFQGKVTATGVMRAADGVLDGDVATVGQLNAATEEITSVTEGAFLTLKDKLEANERGSYGMFGDSKTQIVSRGALQLRDLLVDDFGSSGIGHISISSTASPGRDIVSTGTYLDNAGSAVYALDGLSIDLSTGETYELNCQAPIDEVSFSEQVIVFYMSGPGYGTFDVSLGTSSQSIDASGVSLEKKYVVVDAGSFTCHDFAINSVSGNVSITEVIFSSPNTQGVWFHFVGNGGTTVGQAKDRINSPYSDTVLAKMQLDQATLRYGTNSWSTGVDPLEFKLSYDTIISKIREINSSTGLTVVGLEDITFATPRPYDRLDYVTKQIETAGDNNATLAPLSELIPSWPIWDELGYASDDVHSNSAGGQLIGEFLYEVVTGKKDYYTVVSGAVSGTADKLAYFSSNTSVSNLGDWNSDGNFMAFGPLSPYAPLALQRANNTLMGMGATSGTSDANWFNFADQSGYLSFSWFSYYDGTDWRQSGLGTLPTRMTRGSATALTIDAATSSVGADNVISWNNLFDLNTSGDLDLLGDLDAGGDFTTTGTIFAPNMATGGLTEDIVTFTAGSGLRKNSLGNLYVDNPHGTNSTTNSVQTVVSNAVQDLASPFYPTGTPGLIGGHYLAVNDPDAPSTRFPYIHVRTNGTFAFQIGTDGTATAGNRSLWFREGTSTELENNTVPWVNIYSTDNEGSGSGLDADLLDGLESSSYLENIGNTDLTISEPRTLNMSNQMFTFSRGDVEITKDDLPSLTLRETTGGTGAMIKLIGNTPPREWRIAADYQGIYNTGSLVFRDAGSSGGVAMELEKQGGSVHINRVLEMENNQIKDMAPGSESNDAVEYDQFNDALSYTLLGYTSAGNATLSTTSTNRLGIVAEVGYLVDTLTIEDGLFDGQELRLYGTQSPFTGSRSEKAWIDYNTGSATGGIYLHSKQTIRFRWNFDRWFLVDRSIPYHTGVDETIISAAIDTIYPSLGTTYRIDADAAAGPMTVRIDYQSISTTTEFETSLFKDDHFFVKIIGGDQNTVTFELIGEAGASFYYSSFTGSSSEAFSGEIVDLKFVIENTDGTGASEKGYYIYD